MRPETLILCVVALVLGFSAFIAWMAQAAEAGLVSAMMLLILSSLIVGMAD